MQPSRTARGEIEVVMDLERKEILSLLREVQGLNDPEGDEWDPDRLMWLA